jgi:hypothetical protein
MSSLKLIFGRLQKGKSTLAAHEAARLHKAQFFFDPGETFEHGTIVYSAEEMNDLIDDDKPKGLPEPPIILRSVDPEKDIDEFSSAALRCEDCSIVVDEASFLQSPHYLHPALSRLIRKGPKQVKNRDLIFTQHRASDCNGLIAGMAHEYYFFETTLPRDLERIGDMCGQEVADRVGRLGFRDFLCYSVSSKKFYVNNSPDSWHVDLTPRSPRGHSSELPTRDESWAV